MGIAIPGAIAAKLADRDRKVIAACGDGGFLMTVYDLMTAKDLDLPLTVVIFDDGYYSQIEWKQKSKFAKSYFADFRNPDFVKLAESLGCKAARIKSAGELSSALETALNSRDVFVLDVPVDRGENDLLTERLGKGVKCP
jgi:acetolactate synthase I/II/III large subunit